MADHNSETKIRVVHGKSMYPFLQPDNILVYKKVPENHLAIGDLIVFGNTHNALYSSSHIAHRLVKKIKTPGGKILYQAKGDANHSYDHPVAYEDIIGKVYFVEKHDKFGAKKLLKLDSWSRKKVNYFLAKISCFKSMTHRLLLHIYHLLKSL